MQYIDSKVAETEALRGDAAFNSMVDKLSKALYLEKSTPTDRAISSGRVTSGFCPEAVVYVPGVVPPECGNTCQSYVFTTPILTQNVTYYVAQPVIKTLWNQYAPFNSAYPSGGCNTGNYSCGNGGNNNKYLAGCVPVAEGQVVAYFYSRNNPTWQTITNKNACDYSGSGINTVSSLLKAIFLIYGSRGTYGCSKTGVYQPISDVSKGNNPPLGISPIFGLRNGEWRPYNVNDIRNSLANGSPVIINRSLHLTCIPLIGCWGSGKAHEWIIDGMRDLQVRTTYQVTTSYYGSDYCSNQPSSNYTYSSTVTTATEIWQNWGLLGGNGWYGQGIFEPNFPHTEDLNFNHANYIIAYITPL